MKNKDFTFKIDFKMPKKTQTEPYWGLLVETWFSFNRENFNGEEPSFDGSSPRDLKSIIVSLRTRAEKKGVEWSAPEAITRFRNFLSSAKKDNFLSQNFLLFNINRQKDKIFLNMQAQYRKQTSFNTGITGASVYDNDK